MSTEPVRGWVHEIFTSIQGEGIYCGQRHTFVRFAGCNLDCAYCDTPASRDPEPKLCLVQPEPGADDWVVIPNPLSTRTVIGTCRRLRAATIALTGGEPLAQEDFAVSLLRELKQPGFRTYLETNGTLPEAMRRAAEYTDIVAMDVKLESAGGASVDRETHLEFLRAAAQTEVFVKAVVGSRTTVEEVAEWSELIVRIDRGISLVLQPVTGPERPSGDLLFAMQDTAGTNLRDIRVIPQCHKLMGLL